MFGNNYRFPVIITIVDKMKQIHEVKTEKMEQADVNEKYI